MIPAYTTNSGIQFVSGLGPAAWFRYGVGITSSLGAVSQWNDQSGNGRHLKQATGTNQPAVQADNSILFDGADNFLKCDAFTLVQPETVYFLGKQITWLAAATFFDGNTANTGRVRQDTATPTIDLIVAAEAANNGNLAIDTYGVVCAVFNGSSSVLQVNNTTPETGDVGVGDMGGFTLGARGNNANFGNIQVKEVIVYPAAHSAATRARVISYLMAVGGL